jgi:predicted flap endonuclease-1-like 5' DNA nuclease
MGCLAGKGRLVMGRMPKSKSQTDSRDRKGEDLTAVKGIGPARRRWLREAMSVHSYQDLAGTSAPDIEARLKAEGQVISKTEIGRWVAQAQGLALAANEPTRQSHDADGQ